MKCAPSVHAVCTCGVERKAFAVLTYSACTTQRAHLFVSRERCTLMRACVECYPCHCLLTTSLYWRWGPKALTTETRWGKPWHVPAANRLNGFVRWYRLTSGHSHGKWESSSVIQPYGDMQRQRVLQRSNMTHAGGQSPHYELITIIMKSLFDCCNYKLSFVYYKHTYLK